MDNFVFETVETSASAKYANFESRQYKEETVSIDDNSTVRSISFKSIQNFNGIPRKAEDQDEIKTESDKVEWTDFTKLEKFRYIFFSIFKIIVFIILLYMFLLSLSFLAIGFTLISPYALKAKEIAHFLLKNPLGSLAIGVLATAIMQNATATTSIVVTMVGVGIIPLETAVPIIMGSNIGTCLTNIFIALAVSKDPYEYKRAFSAAIINDLFNLFTTAILLPLEIFTNFLSILSQNLTEFMTNGKDEFQHVNFVAYFLDPVVDLFILLDKEKVTTINMNSNNTQIALRCCGKDFQLNGTNATQICNECDYWCMPMLEAFGDGGTGIFWIIVSLAIHLGSLFGIVKIFSVLIEGPISEGIRKVLNASLFGSWKILNNTLLFILSFQITLVVQSLDIVTATLVPLCGIGIINLQRTYVMTLGSNLGTTVTGILSALTQTGPNLKKSLEIALVYTFFNLFGILFWLPIPSLQFPITIGKIFGNLIFKYKWLTYVYSISVYFLIPTIVFGLALIPNWIGLIAFFLPITVLMIFYIMVKLLQKSVPHKVPVKLKNFSWIPKWIRSLEYWDSKIMKARQRKNKNILKSISQLSIEKKISLIKENSSKDEKQLAENLTKILQKVSTIETMVQENDEF